MWQWNRKVLCWFFCCAEQKRTGKLCCVVIRASDIQTTGLLALFKEDKGALLHLLRHWGDNSHYHGFVMCRVFCTDLFLFTSWLQLGRSLSFQDFPFSFFVQWIVHRLNCFHSVLRTSISNVASPVCSACAKWRCYWGYTLNSQSNEQWQDVNPQPTAATPAPTCTLPAESACLCDVTDRPVDGVATRRQHSLSPLSLTLSDKSDFCFSFLPQLHHLSVFSMSRLSSLWFLWSPWKSRESCPL